MAVADTKRSQPRKPGRDPRRGLNGSMSYTDARGRSLVFKFRCTQLSWGYRQIYDESEGRERRAMYPHRTAPNQFTVEATCIGYSEKEQLNAYLRSYGEFAITPDPSTNIKMTVSVPARKFMQVGVLKQGIEYGDHVASMVWTQMLVFEAAFDPLDKSARVNVSRFTFDNNDVLMNELLYFYPSGPQLSAGQYGNDYTVPPASGDHALTGAVKEAAEMAADVFDDTANTVGDALGDLF